MPCRAVPITVEEQIESTQAAFEAGATIADAQWCGAGIGANQYLLNEWSIAASGHTRTGLEDNVRLDSNNLAPSNAALVERTVALCEKYRRPVATWKQAREILGLQMNGSQR